MAMRSSSVFQAQSPGSGRRTLTCLRQDALLQIADRASAESAQDEIGRDQRDATPRHGGAWLLADQPVLQQHLDLAVAVGQAAGGDLGAGDGLLEDDD